MKGNPAFIKYIVIIFPIIFLWAGLNFDSTNYLNDPEYIFLMNAFCICDGQSVGHIDNPGTTLIQIGAGTMGVMHLFANPKNETIVEQVLKNPNQYIEGIRKVTIFLKTLFLLFLGWVVYKKTRSIWPVLMLQLSTLLSVFILERTWAKHYGGNHYLIPVVLLAGISIYFILNIIKHIFDSKSLHSLLLPVIVLAFVSYIAWNHPSNIRVMNKEYKTASEEIDTANLWVERNYEDYTQIVNYTYSLNKYTGLKFGTDYANGGIYPHLKKLFPKIYIYELPSNTYLNWNRRTSQG